MRTAQIAGRTISRLGLGCFPLTGGYGAANPSDGLRVIHAALDAGISLFDTSDAYAAGQNEILVGQALAGRRASAVVATKFGWVVDSAGRAVELDSSPPRVRAACDASLRRLRTDYIDLYIQHRTDPNVPIEETMGELIKLMDDGKIRAIGLSEVAIGTLKRAHAVRPVGVLQTEYSIWSREPEIELLPECSALGVAFMAYSPLGRGFLSGSIRATNQLSADDYRLTNPRFKEENLVPNMAVVDQLATLARRYRCTRAQLALAWLLAQSANVIAIPGTRHVEHLQENVGALAVTLAASDVAAISRAIPPEMVHGERHPAEHMKTINR